MILLAFDLETTGLDFGKDRPIEVGAVLYSTSQKKCLESQGFLVKTDVMITEEITRLTGVTKQATERFGFESGEAFETVIEMYKLSDGILGHNIRRFDTAMLRAWSVREQGHPLPEKFIIDTYTDLPDAEPGKLGHMAANVGFLNMFPHSALADCQTCIKLLQHYDFDKTVERAKSPMVVVQAHQARHENDLAKKAKFRWFPDRKIWWRWLKEMDLESFAKDLQFDISVHRENIEEFQSL